MLNLTQHPASPEQVAAGVIDLPAEDRAELQGLLTFGELPGSDLVLYRADCIAALAKRAIKAAPDLNGTCMIGGALWLMAPLAEALRARGIEPFFAFSVRETEEAPQADGSVRKIAVFRHKGFVRAL